VNTDIQHNFFLINEKEELPLYKKGLEKLYIFLYKKWTFTKKGFFVFKAEQLLKRKKNKKENNFYKKKNFIKIL
jgi:hypothetical protein